MTNRIFSDYLSDNNLKKKGKIEDKVDNNKYDNNCNNCDKNFTFNTTPTALAWFAMSYTIYSITNIVPTYLSRVHGLTSDKV